MLMSTSNSGQWMPWPSPINSQMTRCCGSALDSRGYHETGTLTILPSLSETVSASSLISTLTARGLLANVEILIPNLRQSDLVLGCNSFYASQLWTRKAPIPSQTHRAEPE